MQRQEDFKMDHYLNPDNVYQRLEEEFQKYGRLILCVDYDDTIYDFHKKGRKYEDVLTLLKRWQAYADIIIWTGNGEESYSDIFSYCKENNLTIYGINCDSKIKVNGRKIYANAYLDDRAGLSEIYHALLRLIEKIERNACINKT